MRWIYFGISIEMQIPPFLILSAREARSRRYSVHSQVDAWSLDLISLEQRARGGQGRCAPPSAVAYGQP